MKKYTLFIVLFLFYFTSARGQVEYYTPGSGYTLIESSDHWYENLEKYWFYRYRLVNDFTYIGPNPGESLVAYQREKADVYKNIKKL